MITFQDLKHIVSGKIVSEIDSSITIDQIAIDSRKSITPNDLFIALKGKNHNAHNYIGELVSRGVKNFIVQEPVDVSKPVNMLKVSNSLFALQQLASHKRRQFNIPIVGITGSNGKTIIKEWLGQLLSPFLGIKKSPGSYNSQVGVPLSVWTLRQEDEIGIFEAGISTRGEMEKLQQIIQPTIGIFTNIGSAHDEGFNTVEEKISEKSDLFKDSEIVIYCKDHKLIDNTLSEKSFTWGRHPSSDIQILKVEKEELSSKITVLLKDKKITFKLPFIADVYIENALHCIAFMVYQGYNHDLINSGLSLLKPPRMRLELKRGINNCQLIDDSYNNDLAGLRVALDFLRSHATNSNKTVILSDILQSGLDNKELYKQVKNLLLAASIKKVIAIGPDISNHLGKEDNVSTFISTDDYLSKENTDSLRNETVLIKGARIYEFEKIVKRLEEKIHRTRLFINLDALTANLNFYRSKLKPDTKIMVMVKAFAYGSGSVEVANLLQYHRVDYLGVAYADEGVALRKNGIHTPIMVMNPSEDSFGVIDKYCLEPELYNLSILKRFISHINGKKSGVHLKLDTGMHRLGFNEEDIDELVSLLNDHPNITVNAIFSHLVGADDAIHNEYSHQQAGKFVSLNQKIIDAIGYAPIRHLVNSPGIIRFPEYHFDMVRLGIGLYGIETTDQYQRDLSPISSLKTIVSQVNHINKGDTIGYSRKGVAARDSKIATLAIGYGDGYSRAFSNDVGKVYLNGKIAPVIGNVCMDMTMVDVTEIEEVKEGDEAEIFGTHITIREVAGLINTIPYEILTNVSQRVKRVFYTQ